jgi:hypothetical protein
MPHDILNPWTAWHADPTLSKPGPGRPWVCSNQFHDDAPTYWNHAEPEPNEVIAMATATTTTDPNPPLRTAADVFAELAAPFSDNEVRRRMVAGREITYITARTAQRRLSEVCGPDGWECRVTPAPESVRCSITIHLPDGRSITREALGGYPDMPTLEDRVKGGDSDAFKRCASLFGIAQYLYGEEVYGGGGPPARDSHRRDDREPRGQRRPHANGAPARDDRRAQESRHWAGSQNGAGRGREPEPARRDERNGGQERNGVPRDGGKLWGWLKDAEKECGGIKAAIEEFGRTQCYPERMTNWSADQVRDAYDEACEILNASG